MAHTAREFSERRALRRSSAGLAVCRRGPLSLIVLLRVIGLKPQIETLRCNLRWDRLPCRSGKATSSLRPFKGSDSIPRHFDLADNDGEIRIKHKWSPSCFTVRSEGAHYGASYVVGDGSEWPVSAYSWSTIFPRISISLEDVKRGSRNARIFGPSFSKKVSCCSATFLPMTLPRDTHLHCGRAKRDCSATPSTGGARAAHAYSLSAAQMGVLDAKLNYLVNAARRLSRKNWLNVCAGAILGLILAVALPPEAARGILLGLLQTIGHLYGLPEPPMLPC